MRGYVRVDSLCLGRGSIELLWNYNYIRASVAYTRALQTFCQCPDLVATSVNQKKMFSQKLILVEKFLLDLAI